MGDIESFHHDNLERALGQFSDGEDIQPLIRFVKGDKTYEVMKKGQEKLETILQFIEEEMEPDALNLVVLTKAQPESRGDGRTTRAKSVLFAMTYDHQGTRLIDFFDVRKNGGVVEIRDLVKGTNSAKVSIHTDDNGNVEILVTALPPNSASRN